MALAMAILVNTSLYQWYVVCFCNIMLYKTRTWLGNMFRQGLSWRETLGILSPKPAALLPI